MPDVELLADFDRTGRLTAGRRDRAGRHVSPGALILANLDVESRGPLRRPPRPARESPANRRDEELTPIELRATPAGLSRSCQWLLRVRGPMAPWIRVLVSPGRAVSPEISRVDALEYLVQLRGPRSRLFLDATTLPGSPVVRRRRFSRAERLDPAVGTGITIEVVCREPTGESVVDDGRFTVAPVVFPDVSRPARFVYLSDSPDPVNRPTVRDVERGFRRTGISRRKIHRVSAPWYDKWLQDQFQAGYTRAPQATLDVVVNLPRAQIGSKGPPNSALGDFVAEHFPSDGVAVYDEFRTRKFSVRDVRKLHELSFWQLTNLHYQIHRVRSVFEQAADEIDRRGRSVERAMADRLRRSDFFEQVALVPQAKRALARIFRAQIRTATNDARRKALEDLAKDLDQKLSGAASDFRLQSRTMTLPVPGGPKLVVRDREVEKVRDRIRQMLAAENYGGNIEVVPPTATAPLGTLVVGNYSQRGAIAMDPDLLAFFRDQGPQPVFEIDTSWLRVGHVDEVLAACPHAREGGGFSLLLASPRVARRLLEAAWKAHLEGSGRTKPSGPPSSANRSDGRGKVPLTRMLRGKWWLHEYRWPSENDDLPPLAYRNLSEHYQKTESPAFAGEYPVIPGPGEKRVYRADMTVHELLFAERDASGRSTNDAVERLFIGPLAKTISGRFGGRPVIRLPVVYDALANVDAVDPSKRRNVPLGTLALTPNLVNLVVVDRLLLIPKPYAPRMRRADAARVIDSVLTREGLGGLVGRLTPGFVRRRGLEHTVHWAYGEPFSADGASLSHIAAQFRDSFPLLEDDEMGQIEARIRRANPGAFRKDGKVDSGWRRLVIPGDPTVDLFEAYTEIVLQATGMEIEWVDSWSYHVKWGEIHCGINVIREPPRASPA